MFLVSPSQVSRKDCRISKHRVMCLSRGFMRRLEIEWDKVIFLERFAVYLLE